MTRLNNVLAGLAAAGLLLSQPALAAPASRTAASVDEAEGAGTRWAGPAIAVILLVLLITALPLLDDNDKPTSP